MFSMESNSDLVLGLIMLLALAGLTAYYADKKGRSGPFWFFMGLLLGIIAPVLLYFLPQAKEAKAQPPLPPLLGEEPPPKEEALVEMQEPIWHYLDNQHQQCGPVTQHALKELKSKGVIGPDNYVWKEGMADWQRLNAVEM